MRHSLSLLILAGCCLAAPAPVHKPAPTHDIEGCWRMTWHECVSSVWLAPRGVYRERWKDQEWSGTWSLVADQLRVKEHAPDGSEVAWSATLVPPKRGRAGCVGTLKWGGKFALEVHP